MFKCLLHAFFLVLSLGLWASETLLEAFESASKRGKLFVLYQENSDFADRWEELKEISYLKRIVLSHLYLRSIESFLEEAPPQAMEELGTTDSNEVQKQTELPLSGQTYEQAKQIQRLLYDFKQRAVLFNTGVFWVKSLKDPEPVRDYANPFEFLSILYPHFSRRLSHMDSIYLFPFGALEPVIGQTFELTTYDKWPQTFIRQKGVPSFRIFQNIPTHTHLALPASGGMAYIMNDYLDVWDPFFPVIVIPVEAVSYTDKFSLLSNS